MMHTDTHAEEYMSRHEQRLERRMERRADRLRRQVRRAEIRLGVESQGLGRSRRTKSQPPPVPPQERVYEQDELTEIIRIAAEKRTNPGRGKYNYDELLEVGRELGIEEDRIFAAAEGLDEVRSERKLQGRRKVRFYDELGRYASTMIILGTINLLTSPWFLWFLIPGVAWGAPLAIRGIRLRAREKAAMTE